MPPRRNRRRTIPTQEPIPSHARRSPSLTDGRCGTRLNRRASTDAGEEVSRIVPIPAKFLALAALSTLVAAPYVEAAKQTVCTVTVNSSDEKEAFRRSLSAEKYQFVEL